jgi:hypothetical protein
MEIELLAAIVEAGGATATIGILIWVLFDERKERRTYSKFVMGLIASLLDDKGTENE